MTICLRQFLITEPIGSSSWPRQPQEILILLKMYSRDQRLRLVPIRNTNNTPYWPIGYPGPELGLTKTTNWFKRILLKPGRLHSTRSQAPKNYGLIIFERFVGELWKPDYEGARVQAGHPAKLQNKSLSEAGLPTPLALSDSWHPNGLTALSQDRWVGQGHFRI